MCLHLLQSSYSLGCLLFPKYPKFPINTFAFPFGSAQKSLTTALRGSLPSVLVVQKSLSQASSILLSLTTYRPESSSFLPVTSLRTQHRFAKSWLLLCTCVYELSSHMVEKIRNCTQLTSVCPVPRVWIMGGPE